MPAEDAIDMPGLGIRQSTIRNLRFQPQPAGIHAVQEARKGFGAVIEFLNLREQQFANPTDEGIVRDEAIELVPMNREMPLALVLPYVALVDRNAYKVRHDLGQALVVVPFHPDNFDFSFAIGELADLREKHPVLAVEPGKVEIGEDVAEKNEPPVGTGFENCKCVPCAADVRTEMYIRQEQRVTRRCLHAPIVARVYYVKITCM